MSIAWCQSLETLSPGERITHDEWCGLLKQNFRWKENSYQYRRYTTLYWWRTQYILYFCNVTRWLEMRVTGILSCWMQCSQPFWPPCEWAINPINFLIRIIRTLISGAYRVNYKNSINVICECHGWLSRASSPVFREAGLSHYADNFHYYWFFILKNCYYYAQKVSLLSSNFFPRIAHFLPNKHTIAWYT